MRPGWKHAARYADNNAAQDSEVTEAVCAAIEQDFKGEVSRGFMESVQRICREEESSLFKGQARSRLESLRTNARVGMGRSILDHAIKLAANGGAAGDIPMGATKHAFIDRGAGYLRQVEETYCRESSQGRASKVCRRLEKGMTGPHIDSLVHRVLNPDGAGGARRSTRKKGLDDGVKLR
jgi:hypothetical protein